MSLLAAALMLALTRAEIIERFRAPVITKANGFVQVFADCPADMRREYQVPVASFAANLCTRLSQAAGLKSPRYEEPGIIVYIGDERTNRTDVIVRPATRDDGSAFTRFYLPAPGFSDVERFRLEVAKAFHRAALKREIDDDAARRAMIDADPKLRIAAEYARLEKWLKGSLEGPCDDEEYLKLARSVLAPGVARTSDVLRFASRLRLYPKAFDVPFCRRYRDCTFEQAIELAGLDPRVRFAALEKAPFVVAYGGGRGDELTAAAEAYSTFLFALARYTQTKDELKSLLDEADVKLELALEAARNNEKEDRWQP